jgi:hypothetical protein
MPSRAHPTTLSDAIQTTAAFWNTKPITDSIMDSIGRTIDQNIFPSTWFRTDQGLPAHRPYPSLDTGPYQQHVPLRAGIKQPSLLPKMKSELQLSFDRYMSENPN